MRASLKRVKAETHVLLVWTGYAPLQALREAAEPLGLDVHCCAKIKAPRAQVIPLGDLGEWLTEADTTPAR